MKRKSLLLMALVGLLAFVGCTKEPSTPEEHFDRQGLVSHFDKELIKENVAYLGGLHPDDERWVRARSSKGMSSSADGAKVIIIGNELVSSQEETLKKAYEEGRFIIIGNAKMDSLRAFRERNGWKFPIPARQPEGRFAYGIAKNHSFLLSFPLHKNENGQIVVDAGASPFQAMRGMIIFISNYLKGNSQTKSSVDAGKLDIPNQIYSENFPMYEDVSYKIDSDFTTYYYRIFREFGIQYSVYSCYAPEGSSEQLHGDYYSVKAIGTNYPPTMYERASSTDTVSIDGKPAHFMWGEQSPRGLMKIKGPWNSQVTMAFHAQNAGDLIFCIEGHPSPESDIQVKDYTTVKTKSWEVSISGGFEAMGKNKGGNIGASFGVGGSTENWVAYSMSDIGVKNYSDNSCASYEFNYQNLPKGDKPTSKDWDNASITTISTTRADFEAAWIWQSSSSGKKKDYDGAFVPLVGEFSSTVDVFCEDRNYGTWYARLMHETEVWTDKNFQMEVVRIPVGCLRIDNKCQNNQILFNIQITDNSTNEVVYTCENSIGRDEHLEVLLPQKERTYSVSMDVGQSRASTVPYYSFDSQIEMPLLIDKKQDTRILTMVESGGDFTSRSAYLQVINQARSALIRNLRIFTADGTLAYSYPNSLGYNNVADIYLNPDVEYYATMEYGSATNFKNYRSASSFTIPYFSSEKDKRILIASYPEGGDFVEIQ